MSIQRLINRNGCGWLLVPIASGNRVVCNEIQCDDHTRSILHLINAAAMCGLAQVQIGEYRYHWNFGRGTTNGTNTT